MTTTKICQHCQGPLTNARAKNCADCMAMKNAANKEGFYKEALAALDHAAAEGLAGAEYRSRAQEVYAELRDGKKVELRRRREENAKREVARKAAKAERDRVNGILYQHGYRWTKEDAESMDYAGAGAFDALYGNVEHVWLLIAPDGREVSVARAMEEIAAKGA